MENIILTLILLSNSENSFKSTDKTTERERDRGRERDREKKIEGERKEIEGER